MQPRGRKLKKKEATSTTSISQTAELQRIGENKKFVPGRLLGHRSHLRLLQESYYLSKQGCEDAQVPPRCEMHSLVLSLDSQIVKIRRQSDNAQHLLSYEEREDRMGVVHRPKYVMEQQREVNDDRQPAAQQTDHHCGVYDVQNQKCRHEGSETSHNVPLCRWRLQAREENIHDTARKTE